MTNWRRRTLMMFAAVSLMGASSALWAQEVDGPGARQQLPGTRSQWHEFPCADFEVNGRPVLVVIPKEPAAGRPWVWHGEFFGHRPAPDIELLKRGFHIVYTRIPDMLGCPDAVQHWDQVYSTLTEEHGFHRKPGLVGLSRGGLYCYNWAIANPDCVSCIYGDAPVCDFRSWPGGFGAGKGSPRDWKLVLERYGFASDEEARSWGGQPVDNLEPLASARVPLLHVYGTADAVVPWEENTGVIAQRYRALGGSIRLIAKPGIGHHPHGLDDPTPIVEFFHRHASARAVDLPVHAVRVLTYNLHHCAGTDGKVDVERIAGVVRQAQPDLVALQEVDQNATRSGDVDQVAELTRLTQMHSVFGANIDLQGGKYGNAVLSRFPIVASQNHLLPNVRNGEQRGVLDVTIRLPEDQEIRFLATHLDHRRDDEERIASAKFINQLVEDRPGCCAILAGDLNDTSTSETMNVLWQEWTNTSTHERPTIPVTDPGRQIDFILYRPSDRFRWRDTSVLDESVASDHRPLLTTLEYSDLSQVENAP